MESTPKFKVSYVKTKRPDLDHLEKQYESHQADLKNWMGMLDRAKEQQARLSQQEEEREEDEREEDEEEQEEDEQEQENIQYSPYKFTKFQSYYPILSKFFDMNETNYDSITLNHKYSMVDLQHVYDTVSRDVYERPVFVKFAPLIDPVRYLVGKYGDTPVDELPDIHGLPPLAKLADTNNFSQVDNFFCFLGSKLLHDHGLVNAVDYYGSYMGVQEKFRYNAADDYDYLVRWPHFNDTRGIAYEIDQPTNPFSNFGSRSNKDRLQFADDENVDLELDDLSIDDIPEICGGGNTENTCDEVPIDTDDLCDTVERMSLRSNSTNSSNDSLTNYSEDSAMIDEPVEEYDDDADKDNEYEEEDEYEDDEEEEEEEDEEEEEEDDDPTLYTYIRNFPVQMICLEECAGTLDSLFVKDKIENEEMGLAAMMQIVMTLIAFQRAFRFTHNDLHTQNITYVTTTKEFLYYKFNKKIYKVPTYGRIFKLIDFGRAIYKYGGKVFCSDCFSKEGDAYGQYNFEPYFNDCKPRVEPNYAFDLCRLGCAIYDFVLDESSGLTKSSYDQLDAFQRVILKWVRDDNGYNVLYKKNGDERYPQFKLYKMIARTVHKPTPESQLNDPAFKRYMVTSRDDLLEMAIESDFIDLDAIPCYAE